MADRLRNYEPGGDGIHQRFRYYRYLYGEQYGRRALYDELRVARNGPYCRVDSRNRHDRHADDIGEQEDLSQQKPRLAREMKAQLDRWLRDSGARMPTLITDH